MSSIELDRRLVVSGWLFVHKGSCRDTGTEGVAAEKFTAGVLLAAEYMLDPWKFNGVTRRSSSFEAREVYVEFECVFSI